MITKGETPVLSRYEGKTVRLITEDGTAFSGKAEVYPSGYGLHEFGRAEESIRIRNTHVFLSQIQKIEDLSEQDDSAVDPRRFDDLMGSLLEGPYWIADILPEQVPRDSEGQYFAVERYYFQPERLRPLRRKFAEILLRLNCYDDMTISFDSCESWERNPDPEEFADRLVSMTGNSFLRAIFETQGVMIDIEPDDTYMTVYDPDSRLLDRLRALTTAGGLFLWSPPD